MTRVLVLSRSAACAALAVLVAACTGLGENISRDTDAAQQRTSLYAKAVGTPADGRGSDDVVVNEGFWIAKSSIRLAQPAALPKVFSSPAVFNRRVRSLSDFAERISTRIELPVHVTPDALEAAARGPRNLQRTAGLNGAGSGGQAPSSLQMPLPPSGVADPIQNSGYGQGANLVYRDGDLKGLLDMVATRFGVSWKYVDGAVEFYHLDTRTFQVNAVPGDSALNANVGNGSSFGSGGGGDVAQGAGVSGVSNGNNASSSSSNGQNTAVKSQLSVFSSLEKSIGAMLSAHGSVVSSPATGNITVTDTPEILNRVEKVLERENRALSRQVMINVTVLSVSLTDQDNYGVNWDLVYRTISRQYGIKNTFNSGQDDGTAFSAAILNTSSSKLAGSSLMINALSTQGKVRKETSASVATLNHQPVPVQVARQTAYLKSSQTTLSANVGSSTSLTPGVVTSGFTMTVLPHVLDNGTVMLQFSTDISSLRRITTVGSGANGNLIQTPEIDTRNFLQRVAMKSGQTLVVSGFEQLDSNTDRQGTGTPSNFLLGGGLNAQSNKEVIVILVTPITMPGA